MKILPLFAFLLLSLFGCDLLAQNDQGCFGERYQPKSEAEVASMTTRQLIDELIRLEPRVFKSYEEVSDYMNAIKKRIRQAGDKALPVLTEHMNASFYSKTAFECDHKRFGTANQLAHDIDRFEFRLRGTSEGKQTIDAFEQAIERVEKPGFTERDVSFYRSMFLSDLKGINGADEKIRDTFWVRYRIEMSDKELVEFSNFLIELDPTYPSWSDWDFIKDHSRINEAGNPLQVYVLKEPERFYQAYLRFKETKRSKGEKRPHDRNTRNRLAAAARLRL